MAYMKIVAEAMHYLKEINQGIKEIASILREREKV
jgi:hypothetical protein